MESAPDSNFGAGEHWEWDSQNGIPAGRNYGMIRFDNIVGDAPERIPPGAIVISAFLRLVVWDESAAPPAELRESLVDWNEATETWNSFGGEPGIQADELGVYVADAPVAIGTFDIDVTASVQAWAYDPASNRGWIVVPQSNNGVHVHSAEYAVAADRPALIVQVWGTGCDDAAECDDGNFCNGAEICDSGVCTSGSPVTCDDGNLCTDDSCDPLSGCLFVNNAAPCDDGNACGTDDACSAGTCTGGSALICDDGNLCTDESCDPLSGCIYTNNVASCDDDDVCTEDDFCSEGTCAGTALDPDEVGNVQMHEGSSLTWDDHGTGFTYDVAGGTLADLSADGSVLVAVCLEPGVGEAGFTDPRPDPPAEAGYYYIVRLRGECGPGTYGQSSAGDDRLPLNGCP